MRINSLAALEFPFLKPCQSHRVMIHAVRMRRINGLNEEIKNMTEQEAEEYISQLEAVAKNAKEESEQTIT